MIQPIEEDREDKNLWGCYKSNTSMREPSQCPNNIDLAAYIEGRASKKQAQIIEEHLISCSSCLGALKELRVLLQEPLLDIPLEVKERAKILVEAAPTKRLSIFENISLWIENIYPYLRTSTVLIATIIIIVFVSTSGASFGKDTFLNQRTISSLTQSEIDSLIPSGISGLENK